MSIALGDSGPAAAARALASQVHPVFMLPAVATSLFGAILAGRFALPAAGLHAAAIFLAVYTAHVTDGYVDYYVRDEDDDHPLTRRGCRLARGLATLGFWACVAGLWRLAGPGAALLTAPGWVIGALHAPHLDTHPLGATLGYPVGIGLALVGGFYVQVRTLTPAVLALAGVFVTVLAGIKVIDDAQDLRYDAGIDKRTVAVVLGPARARRLAFSLLGLGAAAVLALGLAAPTVPLSAGLAALPLAAVALVARRADPTLATKLLIRGSYLFLAVLVAAVWFRPLS